MLLLARCLDWICNAIASGAQNELRINALICPCARRKASEQAGPSQVRRTS
jgi:hypothetical protein